MVQLAAARAKKKELAALDKLAVAKGLPKPSLINRAAKKHPLLLDDKGGLKRGFDPRKWLGEQTVPVPVAELLALSSEYNQAFKEALGFGHTKVANNITSSSIPSGHDKPLANATLEESSNTRKVLLESSFKDDNVTKNVYNNKKLLTNSFDQIIAEGGTPLQVVQLSIGDHDFEALLDIDATCSIIPLSILRAVGIADQVIKETKITLSFAGRRHEKPYGLIKDVPLLFSEDLELNHSFSVVDFENFPMILGMDFIFGSNASVTPHLHELVFDIMDEDGETISEQIIIDTHDGTGINKIKSVPDNSGTTMVMNIILATNVYDEKVIELTEDVTLDPLDISPVTFRTAELAIVDNTRTPMILNITQEIAKKGLIMCPTIVHPSRLFETILGNTTTTSVTLEKGTIVGMLSPAECQSLNELTNRSHVVEDIEVVQDYLSELIDYQDESSVPSVLNSPIFLPQESISNVNHYYSNFSPVVATVHSIDTLTSELNKVELNNRVKETKTTVGPEIDTKGYDVNPALSDTQRLAIVKVLDNYDNVFAKSMKEIKTLITEPYTIRLKADAKPKRSRPYAIPRDAQDWLKGTLEELEKTGKIERASIDTEWASPAILIPADLDKRHKKKGRPVKGVARNYRIEPKAKSPRDKSWGSKIYNIDTHTFHESPNLSRKIDYDQWDTDDEVEDENMQLYLDQQLGNTESRREKQVELKDKTVVKYTTVAASLSPSKDPYRLVIDYKYVNSQTHTDYHHLPEINLLFTQLGEAKYLTIMDAMKGFWQLPMDPASKQYTAFTTPFGTYQWLVMPMGLHSSPSWWQRCMDITFGEAMMQYFMMYIDDGILYSTKFDDHVVQLDKVLQMAEKVGLSMSKKKCKFGYQELKILGYVVGVDGFRMDTSKIDRIMTWPIPRNPSELRTFIGGIQYYRRFFSHLSDVAQGMIKLLKKNVKFIWDTEAQESFNMCKRLLCSEPVLIHPDFNKSFVLYCDASRKAISGILSQEDSDDPNILHPIYYGSRALLPNEKNFAVYELEMLAIVYFLKYYRYYILGKHVKVITDHQSLKYMMKIKEDSFSRVVKWLLSIMEYDIEVYYRPGPRNGNADMLSRMPTDQEDPIIMPTNEEIISDYYLPIFNVTSGASRSQEMFHGISSARYKNLYRALSTLPFLPGISDKEKKIVKKLASDHYINPTDNLIYKRGNERYGSRLLVKSQDVLFILKRIHDHWLAGHLGVTRTFINVSKQYYWPNYYDDVKLYVLSCPICQKFTAKTPPRVPLQPIPVPVGGPLSEIMIDFCTLPDKTETGFSHILVLIDMFSGWIECHPCNNQQADITVLGIYEWICRYGIPQKILCDGGPHFVTKIVDMMMDRYGIRLALGPSHHSQRQGKVERVIQTLKGLLKKLCAQYQGSWINWLSAACYVIRTNVYFGHGFTPFFLLHGRNPRDMSNVEQQLETKDLLDIENEMLIDEPAEENVIHKLDLINVPTVPDEIELDELAIRLEEIIKLNEEILPGAIRRQIEIKKKQAANYDKQNKTKGRKYRIGDSVLVKNFSLGELGIGNMGATWLGPYRIDKIMANNVYIVSDGYLRVTSPIHANNLKLYLQRPKDNSILRKWTTNEPTHSHTTDRVIAPQSSTGINTYEDNAPSPVIKKRRRLWLQTILN